ncbi:hypothetical protein GCM10009416_16990 [Craurococcus roseus]|uniref:4Fe-4S ferredoxin-type domain-containing protein n=1 Tax=Craurococcus roseus TaxID=77585 RepID=A0ABN1F0F1_9PROT
MRHAPPPLGAPPPGRRGRLAALVAEMEAGRVSHLLHLGGCNPAYDAPAALGFAEALVRVPASVHLGRHFDETAALCRLHAPLPHPLEAWGDSLAFDGTPSLRQPATPKLAPEARGEAEALSVLLGAPTAEREAVRATWRGVWGEDGPGFEARWAAALEEGVAGAAPAPLALPLRPGWDAAGAAPAAAPVAPGLSAVFAPDPHLRDGAFATNAWLQEMPRPLTKIVWGNAVLLAPATAARLGLAPGDEVEVSLGGEAAAPSPDAARPGLPEDVRPRLLGGEQMARRIDARPAPAAPAALRAPVWPAPGHAPETATLLLGGGRRVGGEVVAEGRGYDAYRLRPADGAWTAEGLVLRPTGRRGALVTTDSHHGLDPTDAARVVAPGDALPPVEERPFSLHPDWPYPEGVRAWGMAIDLDACIGCNACAVACQAENNVPVVGPAEVARGREMHWLRVERHHHGAAEAPSGTFQPVPCMHCEKAPCEPVCPVNATLHDHEGLNVMVHARCVGTRTCSNNCPYKVRRFNWADHRRALATPARNPEVPLRPRGVMEKCTYCSHRIAEARQRAAADDGAGGAVETACQRACPTQAIAFGDLNDPGSAVSRARRDGRSYALLAELGTRPRTTYLARVARPAGQGAEG